MGRKIAILVIHGIGQQKPFQTLDEFVRPFIKSYEKFIRAKGPDPQVTKDHLLKKFPKWIESCISISCDVPGNPGVDMYEYYWAHMTQQKIKESEVKSWIQDVAKGAERFYRREARRFDEKEKNDELFSRDGEFRHIKYLVKMLRLGHFLGRLYHIAKILGKVKPIYISNVVNQILRAPLVDYLGDVTLYCCADKKTQYFEVRRRILEGAVEMTKHLLENEEYSEIILVGHSLGSVVGYDTLDRLNKEMNVNPHLRQYASKIKGVVTFGSPLDKIAFFFDEHINPKRHKVRYAIVSQLHGFKRVNIDSETLKNNIRQYFQDVKWLNFWSKTDPISGHLDVYKDVRNIEMDFSNDIKGFRWWGAKLLFDSHFLYWRDDRMYEKIIQEFGLG